MAERILIRRAASILIAISVVLSSFTGFLIFAVGDAGQALPSNEDNDGAGDWFIGEDYDHDQSEKYVQGGWSLSGNLTIRSGGVVVIDGGTLEFAQEFFGPGHPDNKVFSLIIEDGGKLVLKNATLTARINDIAYAFPSLGIVVRNGGVFEAYDSTIIASGHLVVDDSTFNLTRSKVTGPSTDDVESRCVQTFIPKGEFDDSLVMLFMSSRVNLIGSSIEGIYEPTSEEERKQKDFDTKQMFDHDYGFVKDVNGLYDAENKSRVGASYLFYRMPSSIANDAPTGVLDDLTKDDLKSYIIGATEKLWLDGFDIAGLMFSGSDDVELMLNIEYTTGSDYNPADLTVNYMFRNGVWANTGMVLEATPVDPVSGEPKQRTATWAPPSMSAQDLHGLNIEMNNVGAGTIEVDRVWVSIALTLDTYRNITLAGNTDFTAVDTFLGVDQSDDADKKNRMVLMDDSQAYLYGIYIDGTDTPKVPSKCEYPFITVETTFQATASIVGGNDNTGESLGSSLYLNDGETYRVEPNEIMHLAGFETVEIRGTVLGASASFNYDVNQTPYSQENYIQWSTGSVFQNSPLNPTSESYSPNLRSFDIHSLGLRDMDSINELNIQFVNGDPTANIQFDKIWLDITISPTIYIYRWADFNVTDSIGQFVNGAGVHANIQSTGAEAHYYTPDGVRSYPADEVMKYLGKNRDNYNVTGLDGTVRIPYLSEIKNNHAYNPIVNITYSATVSFDSELWGNDSKSQAIVFHTYLALSKESASMKFDVVLDNLLILLPDLVVASSDISFAPRYVMYGSEVTTFIYVRNQGEYDATNVLIEAYDGAKLLGTANIDVSVSSSATASITWTAGDHVGEYPITILVNRDREVQESNYLNNEASRNITVGMPISDEDLVIGGKSLTVTGSLDVGSNIRIIEDGRLIMNGGSLVVLQNSNGNFTLTVSDNGALELINGASLTSNRGMIMFLNESANLWVNDSAIRSPVTIVAEGSSTLAFNNALIDSAVECSSQSQARVDATNTTFGKAWTEFGGHAVAHLTNVAIPSISTLHNAKVHIYSWLSVTVWDGSGHSGAGHPLPGADVTMGYLKATPDGIPGMQSGTTDDNGDVLFKALRSTLTQNKVENMGSVLIRAAYAFGEVTYYDDVYGGDPNSLTSVSMGGYSAPLARSVITASLHISDAKPDLVPQIGTWATGLTRGKETTLQTTIVNEGAVDAHNVRVVFIDEETGWKNEQVIPLVPKGGQVPISANWTATCPIGAHNLALAVDPLNDINESNEANNEVAQEIIVAGIIDLSVNGGVIFDPAVPAATLTTLVKVEISNHGDITATGAQVRLYATAPDGAEELVATKAIASLGIDKSTIVEFEWAPMVSGEHTLRVEVDEGDTAVPATQVDNELTLLKTVIDLPDLSIISSEMTVSSNTPGYIVYGDEITANLIVRNNGLMDAASFVEIYVAGALLGSQAVNVPARGLAEVSFSWTADLEGTYDVKAIVNGDKAVRELSYNNNEANKSITVDVEYNANNYIVGGDYPNLTIPPKGLPLGKNLWVIGDGVLTVDAATLTIVQSVNEQFQIVVSENGKLVLKNGASLQSNFEIDLILRDNAMLVVEASSIGDKVRLIAEGSSELTFNEATIGQGIVAPLGSTATIRAVNTTFSQAWTSFGGDAVAHLTNVKVDKSPALVVKDNAVIHLYRWLAVTVWDGAGHEMPGAYVAVTTDDMAPYSNGVTNQEGAVLFKVKVAQLVADKPAIFLGGYFVNTTYWHDGELYEGDDIMSIHMAGYSTPLQQVPTIVDLTISDAKPDIDPPIYFDNEKPARGQTVLIWTHIVNNGPVDAYDVMVLFKDNTTGTELYSKVIPIVPKGGQANAVNVSFSWTATYPLKEHVIFLSVDPHDEINELDETNNNNTRSINVEGIADLVVGPGDITFDPATPARGRNTTISVRVTNQGDVKADNVNVSIYVFDPLGQRSLIGTQFINVLSDGTSAYISLRWTPALAESHMIQVIVDGERKIGDIDRGNNEAKVFRSVLDFPDLRVTTINFSPSSPVAVNDEISVTANVINVGGVKVSNVVVNFYLNEISTQAMFGHATISSIRAGGSGQALVYLTASLAGGVLEEDQTIIAVVNPDRSIVEIDHDNNDALQKLTVKENRPDIIFTGEVEVGRDAGPAGSAAIGEKIYISTHAKNNGTTPAYEVLFAFYAVDGMGMGTEIGRLYNYVGIGQEIELNITWTVNITMGSYTLEVISNEDGALEEIDDTENIVFVAFTVEAPNTKITFDKLPGPSYEPGRTVFISGKVINSNTNGAVVGASVEAWLEKDGQKVGGSFNGKTGSDGTFGISMHLRQGLDGQYTIVVNASIGGKAETTSQLIQVKAAPEGGIPWYVYLLIFALVSAVIIAFSAYLYKYGLGRMVECGECAALIPEASKRCPKCGVQFEPGTAKCSECSAWIPSNSTQCPECGTKFITEAINEEEDAHIKRMREQYESYVETYREEAKIEMGRKYTDARFPTWWKKHPAFISFEQWLSQEEEKLKSGGALCPVCGIHNPRGSPICQKCGSALEAPRSPAEPAKGAPPRKPLRRIVRRPVPGTGRDKPASAEPKAEGEASKVGAPKAPEEGADKAVPAQTEEKASDEAPRP